MPGLKIKRGTWFRGIYKDSKKRDKVKEQDNVKNHITFLDDNNIVFDSKVKGGRDSEKNNVILDDIAVSDEHFVLEKKGILFKHWILTDYSEYKNTKINQKNMKNNPTKLQEGDVIRIGDTEIIFQMNPQTPPEASRSPS